MTLCKSYVWPVPLPDNEMAYPLKTPQVVVYLTVILVSQFFISLISEIIDDLQETFNWSTHWNFFFYLMTFDLWPWPTKVTYIFFHLNCMPKFNSVCSVVKVVTNMRTHRQGQNYYTWGVLIMRGQWRIPLLHKITTKLPNLHEVIPLTHIDWEGV